MGTKIQANPYLQEYHCLNKKWIQENDRNSDSLSSYDIEKLRQTIIVHESTFRNQLRELHRLHGRQQELMNEIKRRGVNKDVMEGKSRLSYLFTPFPSENAKRLCPSSSPHSVAGCLLSGTSSKLVISQIQDKRSLSSYEPRVLNSISLSGGTYNLGFPADSYVEKQRNRQTFKHAADSLGFSFYNRGNYSDRRMLPKAEICANSASNLNLVTKDFFHDYLDRANEEGPLSTLGLRNEKSGKEHSSDEYDERSKVGKHSSAGDLFSGKSLAFPQSLSAEPRKEFSNGPLDIGTSLSRKKKKIFGVEISEGNDDAFSRSHDKDHPVPTIEMSSLVADTRVQNLNLHVADWNGGRNETSKADPKGEISSQKMSSCHSGMNGNWLEGDLKIFKNVDTTNKAPEFMKQDPEHPQKSREMIPQKNQENPIGSLPWFLRNSLSADLNNTTKSSYFMNLDSLQNCSQKFFAKSEKSYGNLQNSERKKGVEFKINKDKSFKGQDSVEVGSNGSRNYLGTKDLVSDDNNISDLRHCIDLNLSLDEEDASSAPSLPSAIVKIATTEIELEAPAVIDSEIDANASHQESDKIAAEAIIAISLSAENEFNSLKWFAEVISSQGCDNSSAIENDESILNGMDYFEFMTLKLQDTKQELYCPNTLMSKTPSDDETVSKRTRRGQSRRGRQWRDFQRDILPGLVTLSRFEVTEDFQAFEELLKAGDSTRSHRCSTRNGRGRKRTSSPPVKTPCSTEAQQPVCQIEERNLTGWGRKTRRLPRQRCPNAFLSFPVKC